MQKELEIIKTPELADLRALAETPRPCLTLYVPLAKAPNMAYEEQIRLKSLSQRAEQALGEFGVDAAARKDLLSPMSQVMEMSEQWGGKGGGTLVVLRANDVFRAFELRRSLREAIYVGDHFQIRPMIKSLQEDNLEFYLLALSHKHVRLLRCTPDDSVEVALPPGMPSDIESWLNTRTPANSAEDTQREPGAGPLGSFTSGTDIDKKDEHLANFYNVINRGVSDLLQNSTSPLVLCGVDSTLSLYRRINTYPHLVAQSVEGSAQSLKGGEMHRRALEIATNAAKESLTRALGIWEKLGGTDRVSNDAARIVKAAHESRIAFLFADEAGSFEGRYDTGTMQVNQEGRTEDLINLTILRTLTYGGEVFITSPAQIPGGGSMGAIYRF